MNRVLQRIAFIASIGILGTTVVVYVGDYTVWRYRTYTRRDPYGTVTVRHYYAVLHKNGKTEFMFDPPAAQTCVQSLFPHGGYVPCWYLGRHSEQRTDI
jgi:hypothetical protein